MKKNATTYQPPIPPGTPVEFLVSFSTKRYHGSAQMINVEKGDFGTVMKEYHGPSSVQVMVKGKDWVIVPTSIVREPTVVLLADFVVDGVTVREGTKGFSVGRGLIRPVKIPGLESLLLPFRGQVLMT